MFADIFKSSRKKREARVQLEVVILKKVTSILFPDSWKQEKDDKVVLTQLDNNELCFIKVKEGVPDYLVSKAQYYNVGKNSVNSAIFAEKIKSLYLIEEDEFSLDAEVEEHEGHSVLILRKPGENVEDAVPEEDATTTEEITEEITHDVNSF